ncbi:unnamed protein product [Paramecium sonneborni]|uniref:Transmembrane protein n=1 Tax=Paramecium sonneborni TaxID=65129 RepID=A0A8S1QWQ9_9CILI|nr:unnamed protein product [Paramecium sonneborni]
MKFAKNSYQEMMMIKVFQKIEAFFSFKMLNYKTCQRQAQFVETFSKPHNEDYQKNSDSSCTGQNCKLVNEFNEICECYGDEFKFDLNRIQKYVGIVKKNVEIYNVQIVLNFDKSKLLIVISVQNSSNATTVNQNKKLILMMVKQNIIVKWLVTFLKTYIVSNAYRAFHIQNGLHRKIMQKENVTVRNAKRAERYYITQKQLKYINLFSFIINFVFNYYLSFQQILKSALATKNKNQFLYLFFYSLVMIEEFPVIYISSRPNITFIILHQVFLIFQILAKHNIGYLLIIFQNLMKDKVQEKKMFQFQMLRRQMMERYDEKIYLYQYQKKFQWIQLLFLCFGKWITKIIIILQFKNSQHLSLFLNKTHSGKTETVLASCFTDKIGYRDNDLYAGIYYAELSKDYKAKDFSALGNLAYKYKLRITYNGKSVIAEKGDVGTDGPSHPKLDIHIKALQALGLTICDNFLQIEYLG